jgi:hypothetical protein
LTHMELQMNYSRIGCIASACAANSTRFCSRV